MAETPRERSVGKSVGIAAAMLSASVLLSSVLGLLRDILISHFYGKSASVDAYLASFTLPDLLNYFIVGGALSITFVPMFAGYLARNDEEGGWRLFSTVTTTMGVLFVAVTVVAEVFAPELVLALKPGFAKDPEKLALTVWMTRLVIPAQLAFFVGGILQSTLYVRGIFWTAALAPLVYNLCIIAGGILLKPFVDIQGFSYGVLAGAFLGPLALPLYAARHRIRYRWNFSFTDRGFIEYFLLSLPLMIGVSLVTLDQWIYEYFASGIPGAISVLGYARKLMILLAHMLGQATAQAALPYLTRLYHEGREREMGTLLAESGRRVAFFAVVATGGLVATAQPVVSVVYLHGAFTPEDARLTASLLIFFTLGLLGWSLQAVLARGFYARKDTLTPMILGTVVVIVSLPVYYALFHAWGTYGLAIASSIGIVANALATLAVYRLKTREMPLLPLVSGIVRGALLAIPCGLAAYATGRYLPGGEWLYELLRLTAMSTVFGITAIPLVLLLRPPEVTDTLKHVLARLKRA